MTIDPANLTDDVSAFLAEYHLATLTTLRPDGTPHVVPVGFTYEPIGRVARIITFEASRKVRNIRAGDGSRAVVCQVDGGRWLTIEGTAVVTGDPARVVRAVEAYAERYRRPGERADRVAIEIAVDRIIGHA